MSAESRRRDPEVPMIDARRAEEYRRAGLWQRETLAELLRAARTRDPQRCALVTPTDRLSYADLHAAVTSTSERLRGLGIDIGDRVVVHLPNRTEMLVLVLALLEIGAPPVLVMPGFGDYELAHVVAVAEPVALAVSTEGPRRTAVESARRLREQHPALRHVLVSGQDSTAEIDLRTLCDPNASWCAPLAPVPAPNDRHPHDAAVFLLSGGTTGAPKVIPRGNAGYAYMIRATCEIAALSADSVYLAVMPAAHGFVLNCPGVLGTLVCGGTVVLADPDDPRRAFALIERERVTHCALVPTLATRWVSAAAETTADLSSLRVVQIGGAPPDPDLAARIGPALGATLQQCYGMSEGLLNYTALTDPDAVVHGTQGRPASPLDEIRIVDDTDREVPDGEMGQLLTRGPYTVAGYYRDPAATAKAFTPEGFYRTGDMVTRTPRGDLVVGGRARDIVNRGGDKIPAADLEMLVTRHPGVRACAVIGAPHALYGEVVCLYVVAEPGAEPGLLAVRGFLREIGVAPYKLPESLWVVDELPTTALGKIDKNALRADLARRTAVEAQA
ncbi:AMP-binding protein [Nocardia sp. AG03]|uniref:(2,3-dihydroxybenzoyl)adenylate synthase n=1 Tax=Nocardia sp. AG03 TaxID=3025312 RepID=UPI00241822AD|nr:AMP-binding protein [Nocardia sp. AG03]